MYKYFLVAAGGIAIGVTAGVVVHKMLEQAEKYYQLVKAGKENTEEANDVKRSLDEIEEQFSDDPAYVPLLRAERNSL